MIDIELPGVTGWAAFRLAIRQCIADRIAPDQIRWSFADGTGSATPSLFEPVGPVGLPGLAGPVGPLDAAASAAGDVAQPQVRTGTSPNGRRRAAAPPARLPAELVRLARHAFLHTDADRLRLIHRLIDDVASDRTAWLDTIDPVRLQVERLAKSVRDDVHRTHAFLRFRPHGDRDGYVAFIEPRHHTIEASAPFFVRRFAAMTWTIATPRVSLHWTGSALHTAPGAAGAFRGAVASAHAAAAGPGTAPAGFADDGESLWLDYYATIFNPARVNPRAMARHMPRRWWPGLPEATLIPSLVAAAQHRTTAMLEDDARATAAASLLRGIALLPLTPAARLARIRGALRHCRGCDRCQSETRPVAGSGADDATLMLVGEQPGDEEDRKGRPFVGPAGRLLREAIASLGWAPERLYLTNAVKHFGFTPRGSRRIHKSPEQQHIAACIDWLEAEIGTVRPRAIVALGRTAASALLGRPVAVRSERGTWVQRPGDRIPVLVTLHPSALLRAGGPAVGADSRSVAPACASAAVPAQDWNHWLQDLDLASDRFDAAAGTTCRPG